MKKLLAMLLALVMIFALVPATLADGAQFTLSIQGGDVKDHMATIDGQKVLAVDLTLNGSVEDTIYGLTFNLTYDASQLILAGFDADAVFAEEGAIPTINDTVPGQVRVGFACTNGVTATAALHVVTLYFALSPDLEPGATIAFALADGAEVETTDVTNPVYCRIAANFAPYTLSGQLAKITKQPTDKTVKVNKLATIGLTAIGENVKYQWYCSTDNGETWTEWNGTAASTVIKGTEENNGDKYRCVVSTVYNDVTSDEVQLIVSGVKPRILVQPKKVTVALNKTATFTVVAAGTGLSYQWYYSTNNGSTWKKWSGKTEDTASAKGTAKTNGNLYRCEITNDKGTVTTSNAKLTVSGVKPRITAQPKAATVKLNKKATFKVVAGGTDLKYQWYYSTNNGTSWKKYSGKTSATLKVKGTAKTNGYLYRCKVTNDKGSVTSKAAKLTVSGVKPKITAQPKAVSVKSGKTAKFTVVAAGTGLKYQWYSSKDGKTWTKMSGKTKATLSVKASKANKGYSYRCVVKNTKGSVTSKAAKLTVK